MSEASTSRILLIIEDPLIGSILRDQLQSLSHSVSLHASPGDGITDAQQQSYPLVIVDDVISGGDPFKLLQELAKARPAMNRILMTSGRDMNAVMEARRSGLILRYLTKPWMKDEVAMAVDGALAQSALRVELEALRARNLVLNQQLSDAVRGGAAGEGSGDNSGAGEAGVSAVAGGPAVDMSIEMAIKMLGVFHPNLGNASLRAVAICRTIGELMELPPTELPRLLWAAALHDIGMLSVDRGIVRRWLRDTAKCTEEELAMIRHHPEIAEEVLKSFPALVGAADVVRHHHEAFDGSGYPDGLKGETIPQLSRILAPVVHFCHRNGSTTQILNELESLSDKQFDPTAVRLLAKALPMTQIPRGERELLLIELKAGMVLGRDLFNAGGHLLLPKGRELKDSDINRIIAINRVTPLTPFVLVYC
ncbi:MAG: Cyclic di-GMP phosphodiesterase response regulator RpfG [Verrucomicrobiota bacterium]|jgi:response regulator RpfG family c-di-GMP phosphodiesterase